MKDPAFISEMKKRGTRMIGPMTGDEIVRLVLETEPTPKPVVDRFRKLLDIES